MRDLPASECRLGYPADQLALILGHRLASFNRWMAGQTVAECDGREYDHSSRTYHATGCGPHGIVVYVHDVRNFLTGGQVWD